MIVSDAIELRRLLRHMDDYLDSVKALAQQAEDIWDDAGDGTPPDLFSATQRTQFNDLHAHVLSVAADLDSKTVTL